LLVLVLLVLALLFALKGVPLGQYINLGFAPVIRMTQMPFEWLNATSLWFQERSDLQRSLQFMRTQLEQQAALIQQARTLQDENIQLRSLLKLADIEGYQWHTAQVLGRSPDQKSQHLILQTQHAYKDSVVVSREGLVGLVDQANDRTASILTILDASVAVPVTLPNSALAALVRGQGDHVLVDFISASEAPKVGVVLQTSGAGGLFPSGIPVARITRITPVPGQVFVNVEAVPTSHWRRDRWLAIASRGASGAQVKTVK